VSALVEFVRESNLIEGIDRNPTQVEIQSHEEFLELREVNVAHLETFVSEVASAVLRERVGMNVVVGPHVPPAGGAAVREALSDLLADINTFELTPWESHIAYETLHPFMDGNGRSGRVLWAWQVKQEGRDPFALPFLHASYYEALNVGRAS
jgi:hypothetical protein